MNKYKIVKRVYLDFLIPQEQVTLKCDSGTVEFDGKHTVWYIDDNGKREETINSGDILKRYVEDGLLVKLPDETGVFEKVVGILNNTELPQWDITRDSKLKDDLGLDSMDIIEFGMEIEKEWNIWIDDDIWDDFQIWTVENVVQYIENKI